MIRREYRVFTMCSGLGGGAKGFQEAVSQIGEKTATWRCIGGIDNDAAACRDFRSLVGVDCTLMDLFTRAQYTAFNEAEPPAGWSEVTPADVRRAAGNEHPHCVFISSPCKGASGLLSETLSRTPKYQALNELTLRCVWLMCEAWKDDPVELIVFENVPRLMNRGRHLLDQIGQILRHYGYAVNETTHDCGEIGGLAQSRKRFLLVARHMEKVPAFLYEPSTRRLQGVGTVLGRMPLPGDSAAGPMHRIPSLQWKTWVRLAFVEAGSDWRSLNRLAIDNGYLRDYLVVPEMHNGMLGVKRWDEPVGVVAGASRATNGSFSVADPRAPVDALQYRNYGVVQWEDPTGAIIGVKSPGQGMFSVADPRAEPSTRWHHGQNYGVVRWGDASGTISGQQWPNQGRFAVADVRTGIKHNNCFRVVSYDQAAGVVTGGTGPSAGGQAVADPRMVPAPSAHHGAGGVLPAANEKTVAVIRSHDGTWHRPFTTLELAALQSLVEPEEYLELDGLSDQAWRERIGNAVPPKAARAVAEVMGTTLLLAESGETFQLSSTPVWVRPVALALTLPPVGTQ
ncbi:DNA cytosine methyltransferase [Paraburkholderia sp. BR10872]|uniref:DNA cytosine methyltransferase n=1 Tax=Paraburkholderia sp. BR10872 TaxID=3236989 RepID=UPI0034D1EED5